MHNGLKPLLIAAVLIVPSLSAIAGSKVYVPMGNGDRILVVDSSTDSVIGKIAEIPNAHGLAGATGGKFLVAGSYDEVLPGEHRAPSKPAGMSEQEHEAHHAKPAAGAPAASKAISFLSIVRIDDGTIVRRVEVPGAVHHTAVTPDGRYAIATHPSRGRVSVVDLETFEVAASVATGPLPNYAVVNSDGSRIYVSNAGNNTVSEIDASRWIVRRNFVTGAAPEHIVLSPDDGFLYVNNSCSRRTMDFSTSTT
jgi:YVTN family beta-propeller protein